MKTPTPEKIDQIAKECGACYLCEGVVFTKEELHTFFLRGIEMGRKEQRESDAKICDDLYELLGKYDGSAADTCGDRIRNNTGE